MAEEPEAPAKPAAGKGIGGKLTKKLGPLPIWAWGLGGAALAFLAYRYIQSRNSSATAATTPATTTPTDLAAGTSSTPGTNGYQDNGQLTSLQSSLDSLNATLQSPASKGPSAAASPLNGFQQLMNHAAVVAEFNSKNLYQEVSPGVFVKWAGTKIPTSGTFYSPINGATSGAGGSASPGVGTAGAPAPIQPPAGIAGGAGIGPLPAVPMTPSPSGLPSTSGGALGPAPTTTAPLVGGPAQHM